MYRTVPTEVVRPSKTKKEVENRGLLSALNTNISNILWLLDPDSGETNLCGYGTQKK